MEGLSEMIETILAAFWKQLIVLVGLVVWFVRLEARSLDNTRRIKNLELENRKAAKELKEDLRLIDDKIDKKMLRLEELLLRLIQDANK